MKRNLLKTATALTMALVMLTLVACGDNGDDTTTANIDTPTTNVPAGTDGGGGATDDEPPRQAQPTLDLGGREIVFLSWWQIITESGDLEAPDPATAGNYMIDILHYNNRRRVEEEFNVRFRSPVIGWDEYLPAVTAGVMAGDPVADLTFLYGGWIFSAWLGNLLMPASAYAPPESDLWGDNEFVMPVVSLDGEVWSFDGAAFRQQDMGLGLNIDLIMAAGAPDPRDLWERGEWTWDAMREVMQLTTRDSTGDGVIDQFGITGDRTALLAHLIASNDGALVDANRQYALHHPNSMAALEFAWDIFNVGQWYFEFDHWAGGPWDQGDVAMFPATTWMWPDDLGFTHGLVPFPVGPNNTRGYTNMIGFTQSVTITHGVPNPEHVFRIYEELQMWSVGEPDLRVEGPLTWLRSMYLTEGDVQRQIHAGQTSKLDLGMVVPQWNWFLGEIAESFRDATETPATAVETHRSERQAWLDSVFGDN